MAVTVATSSHNGYKQSLWLQAGTVATSSHSGYKQAQWLQVYLDDSPVDAEFLAPHVE